MSADARRTPSRQLWIVALATVVGTRAFGATPHVRHWDQAAGLPQATVSSLAQTPDGFLWVGTYGGLARFDGARFRTMALGDEVPFEGLRVTCLLVDGAARLWVGTERGLLRLTSQRLESVSLPLLESPHVTALHLDRSGELWVGTDGHGVFRSRNGRFDPEAALTAQLRGDAVLALGEDEASRLVLGTRSGRLMRVDDGGVRTLASLSAQPISVGPLTVERIGTLVGSRQGLLHRWREGHGLQPVRGSPRGIRSLLQDHDGTVWIGTDEGVFRLAGERMAPVDLGLPSGVHVLALTRGREGALWMGTEVDGLFQESRRWFDSVGPAEGLPGSSVRGTVGLPDGSILAAVDCQSVTRLSPQGRMQHVRVKEHCPWTVLPVSDGRTFIGTYDGPLYVVNAGAAPVPLDLPVRNVVTLYEDQQRRLWVGTRTDGVYVLDPDGLRRYGPASGVPDVDVRFVAEDAQGRIWLATGRGVARQVGDRFEHVGHVEGLPEVEARCIVFDEDVTWVGTYGGGLAGRVGENGVFHILDKRRGLAENVVSRIWRDERWLWWSGNRGVYRALRRDLREALVTQQGRVYPQRFSTDDGLPTNETNGGFQPSEWRDADGSLWLPTVAGLAVLRSPAEAAAPPPVQIDRVWADGQPIVVGDDEVVQLSARVRRLEIEYTSPSLVSPDRTHFLARLRGVDLDWVPQGASRRVQYGRLDPGRYELEVFAVGESGTRSAEPARLTIVQIPALHETWVFRVAIATAIFLLGVGAYALRSASIRGRARDLRRLVAERTAELQEANRRLADAVEELERVASTDKLTGAWNRRRWEEVARIETERARRTRQPLSLVMFDIDRFKDVNDRHGHALGDRVLAEVAQVSMASLRTLDLLARWGGEEFLLLMPGAGLTDAIGIADRLRTTVEAHGFGEVGPVTISLGVAEWVGGGSLDDWVARADAALYRAKAQGRNCVRFDPLVARASRPGTVLGELRWHESYSSGDASIDAEHRELFDRANALIGGVLEGAEPADLVGTARGLVAHAREHFASEERMLEHLGYEALDEHKADHEILVERAQRLVDRLAAGDVPVDTILWFLAYDLVAWHILTSDRQYFPLIVSRHEA